ncbi:MAG: hypothetical protein K8T89_07500 [Planctomycetes bacterium]|nr:hypothetical protein [Planctomycetota bacterium]
MTEPAWIIKWRAREALKNGQPEEAHRLLEQLNAAGNRRAFALRTDVIRGYLDRADRSLKNNVVENAWSDLARVEALAPDDTQVSGLRERLSTLGIAEVQTALNAGNPLLALQAAARLKERAGQSADIAAWEEAAQDWILTGEIAERGDFTLARASLERIRLRLGEYTDGFDRFEQDVLRREDRFRFAWNELQAAAESKNWREMLRRADEVLAVAPRHKEAQQARNRAWQVVQPETAAYRPEPSAEESSAMQDTAPNHPVSPQPPKRFFLWIDGVGAWLVCLNSRVSLGQASPEGGPIDVPLFADVSRIHASLSRDSESYSLETSRDVLLNGRPTSRGVLQSGDRLSLATCSLAFALPVPGCLSATLTPEGGRRLPYAVDGVLLMADMLVLGPGEKVHVRMPDLAQPLYLFRQKDSLGIRWQGEFSIGGERCKDRAMLPPQGSVSSEAFTFAIEPVSR